MRLDPSVTLARAGKRPSSFDKGNGAYPTRALLLSLEGQAKPVTRHTVVVGAKNRPVIAVAQTSTGPVAMHVNGHLVGLALKVGQSFVFFSASHRTDNCDGKVFTSLDAIREAAGEIPSSAI